MLAWMNGLARENLVMVSRAQMSGERYGHRIAETPWPLPNVWLGVSVEDQATADERIPLLLQTPAAVRFVSAEPALSGVDFSRWLGYNPGHETATRRSSLRSGQGWGVGDRLGGTDLAREEARMGSVEEGNRDTP